MATLTIKKVGNHWYPDLVHNLGTDLSLGEAIENKLNELSITMCTDKLTFIIEEVPWIINESEIIYINEEDLTRYYITDDYFPMRFIVNNQEYSIEMSAYDLIITDLDLKFHTDLYQIKLENYENQN